ncbi:MAG: metal-dependent transcriptional regulator [Halothiobacillus sp.]|jgi:DtxR family Mn-dependent transcriptional regulator|nr:metal-dependent transcriptional regulator [Halothiobacillus sp.]
MTSTAYEDYLKAIFKLAEQTPDHPASTSAIAERLGIAQASVTAMLKRLGSDGLIDYERYQGARLTPTGRAVAVDMIRRHRVIETFLVRDLDVPLAEVDAEAEILEHAFSSALIDRLWAHLGKPEFDPHGAPIPVATEAPIERRDLVALTDLAPGEPATIVRLSAQNGGQLQVLTQLGLIPGQLIKRTETPPGSADVALLVGGQRCAVGQELAETVWVLRIKKPA